MYECEKLSNMNSSRLKGLLTLNESRLVDYIIDDSRGDYPWTPYEKDIKWFSILFWIEKEANALYFLLWGMYIEASTHDPYEMMWRKLFVSYDMIVEASNHNLKVSNARGDYPLAFISKARRQIHMYLNVSMNNVDYIMINE